jgi:tetratricopeptide (TPR) repeat protein
MVGRREFAAATTRFERADSAFALAGREDPDWAAPGIERGWLAMHRAFMEIRASDIQAEEPNPAAAIWHTRGIAFSDSVLGRYPDNIEALELRGVLRFRLADCAEPAAADTLMEGAYNDLSAVAQRDGSRARALYTLAALHIKRGEPTESRLAAEKALEADVYAEEANQVLEQLYNGSLYAEDYDAASRWCWLGQRHSPNNEDFLECRLYVLGWSTSGDDEDVAEAWRLNEQLDQISKLDAGWPYRRLIIAAILARTGKPDSARAVIEAAYAETPEEDWKYMAFMEAFVRSRLGDHDRALELLSAYLDRNPQSKEHVARHPWFRELRANPEFVALVGWTGADS